jgi:hypothetical protein
MSRFWLAIPACAAALLSLTAPAHGQTTATGAPTCATVFTNDELVKAVGAGFEDMGAKTRDQGETECAWMARGGSKGFQTVSVQFYDLGAVKASANANTLSAFFETIVSAAEGVATGKRQLLPGIGAQAAFVPTDPQVLAVVQRADGIARIVGNNLTRAQITAVARAVAAP